MESHFIEDRSGRLILHLGAEGILTGTGYYQSWDSGMIFFKRVSEYALSWKSHTKPEILPPDWVDKIVRQHLGIPVIAG